MKYTLDRHYLETKDKYIKAVEEAKVYWEDNKNRTKTGKHVETPLDGLTWTFFKRKNVFTDQSFKDIGDIDKTIDYLKEVKRKMCEIAQNTDTVFVRYSYEIEDNDGFDVNTLSTEIDIYVLEDNLDEELTRRLKSNLFNKAFSMVSEFFKVEKINYKITKELIDAVIVGTTTKNDLKEIARRIKDEN